MNAGRSSLPDEAGLRAELRTWLAANAPPDPGFLLPQSMLAVATRDQFDFLRAWQHRLYEAGYVGTKWPTQYGGRGWPAGTQRIVDQEMARARVPFLVNAIGLSWAGPTILRYPQRRFVRRRIRRGAAR